MAVSERGRHPGPLRGGPRRGDQDPEPALEQGLERLDPLAGDLVVRLLLAQRLALRIERDRHVGEVLQIGEPALGVGRRRCDDGESRWGMRPRARRPARRRSSPAGRRSGAAAPAGSRSRRSKANRGSLERIEQQGAASRASRSSRWPAATSSHAPAARASQSSGPAGSARPTCGERRGGCVSRFNDSRARARVTAPRIAGWRKHRLPRIGIGREHPDGVAPASRK